MFKQASVHFLHSLAYRENEARSKKQIRGLLAIKCAVILRAVHLLLFQATVSEPSFSEALQILGNELSTSPFLSLCQSWT